MVKINIKGYKTVRFEKKGCEKCLSKVWWSGKKAIPLHSLLRNNARRGEMLKAES